MGLGCYQLAFVSLAESLRHRFSWGYFPQKLVTVTRSPCTSRRYWSIPQDLFDFNRVGIALDVHHKEPRDIMLIHFA